MFGQQSFGMNQYSALINPYSYNRPLQALSQDNAYRNVFPRIDGNNNGNSNNYNYHANSPSPPKDKGYPFNLGDSRQIQQASPNQVSFARNFKARLFNVDPDIQKQKQIKLRSYREQLELQVRQAQQKKRKEKEKIEAQDLKFQKEFFKQQQIYAQRDSKDKKQQPSYFVVRSAQKNRKKAPIADAQSQNEINRNPKPKLDNYVQVQNFSENPKISKRAYKGLSFQNNKVHNINPEQQQEQRRRQQSFEQDRISKILLFQQSMLKKLDNLRVEIRNSGNHLQVDREIQGIRLKIRAKPLILPGIDRQTRFNDFYNIQSMKKPQAQQQNSDMYKLSKSFDMQNLQNKRKVNNSPHNLNKSIQSSSNGMIQQRQSQNGEMNDKNFYGEQYNANITQPKMNSRRPTPKLEQSNMQNSGDFGSQQFDQRQEEQ